MLLNFKIIGQGKPVIILHGLFGSLDNWQTIGKQISPFGYCVYLVDQRNHGHSFHDAEHNYQAMCADVIKLIKHENLCDVVLLGHSMGGKTAMTVALNHPELLSKLIVADIAPRYYKPHHHDVIAAIKTVDVLNIKSRTEAESIISQKIDNAGTVQFLLKNLYRTQHHFAWRFNIEVLTKQIEQVGQEITSDFPFTHPTLFMRGSNSDYITDDDWFDIRKLFLQARLETIENAGHWLHADQPEAFVKTVIQFISG